MTRDQAEALRHRYHGIVWGKTVLNGQFERFTIHDTEVLQLEPGNDLSWFVRVTKRSQANGADSYEDFETFMPTVKILGVINFDLHAMPQLGGVGLVLCVPNALGDGGIFFWTQNLFQFNPQQIDILPNCGVSSSGRIYRITNEVRNACNVMGGHVWARYRVVDNASAIILVFQSEPVSSAAIANPNAA